MSADSSHQISKQHKNVEFINTNIINTNNWIPHVNAHYAGYDIVIFTYGCLTYLSGNELWDLYCALHVIKNLSCIISVELIEKEYHKKVITKKVGKDYRHTYLASAYLTEMSYNLKQYEYLFDSRDNMFMVAKLNPKQQEA